jgi:hypothetical protein
MSGLEADIKSALSGKVEIHLKGGGAVFIGDVLQVDRHVSLVDSQGRAVVIDLYEIAAVRVLSVESKEK